MDALKATLCLDVPPNNAKSSYVIPDTCHNKYCGQQRDYLELSKGLVRAITGGGATVLDYKLSNYLRFNRMTDIMLMSVINCDMKLEDCAKLNTPYITTELLKASA